MVHDVECLTSQHHRLSSQREAAYNDLLSRIKELNKLIKSATVRSSNVCIGASASTAGGTALSIQ